MREAHLLEHNMDRKKFEEHTQPLLKWNRKTERFVLKPQTKKCEHCSLVVPDRKVEAIAYKLGTEQQHFKHKCNVCKTTLFNGKDISKKSKYITKYMRNYK